MQIISSCSQRLGAAEIGNHFQSDYGLQLLPGAASFLRHLGVRYEFGNGSRWNGCVFVNGQPLRIVHNYVH